MPHVTRRDDGVVTWRGSPTFALFAYAAGLAMGGVALVLVSPASALGFTPLLGWPVLLIVFCIAVLASVSVTAGRETHIVAFTEIPFVLGLFLASPRGLAVAAVLSSVIVGVLVWRMPPVKFAVSVSASILHAGVGIALFRVIVGDPDAVSAATWAAAAVAVLVADVVAALSVEAAIAIHQGRLDQATTARNLARGLPIEATNVAVGLVGVLLLTEHAYSAGLLLVVAVATYTIYRGYSLASQRSARLEALNRFTRAVDRSVSDSTVAETIATEARSLLRADSACLMVQAGDQIRHLSGSPTLAAESWWRPAAVGSTVRLPRGRHGRPALALRHGPHRDGLAVPLLEGDRVSGALVVADRLDEVSTFDTNDLALLQALAGHAGVALANARLMNQVQVDAVTREHLARYDDLTGLPNRETFRERLQASLSDGAHVSVMLVDVDRFKDVNDTLGHHVGDQLLREVAERLRAAAGDSRMVARLGGDDFAVLTVDEPPAAVDVVASRLLDAVSAQPVSVTGFDLGVRASAGVASASAGENAPQLLRHAEIAMYDAKQRGRPVTRYSPHRDPYDERRLRLAADLGHALRHGHISVHYQPQVDISSRRVLGVEALARWQHPDFGEVPPGEFVPLAARAGLMGLLTRVVLAQALGDCRRWQQRGLPLGVSVNMSAQNLLEIDFAEDVVAMLDEYQVAASAVVLEITESEFMAEPEHSVQVLNRLADVGLTLSVDDFGTGHASLLHLRSLPVGEVKIDRAFVRGVLGSPGDSAIIRSVIDLGHNLGMRVVAEGVETPEDLDVLRRWDCDVAQGFLLGRPMPAPAADRWLEAHAGSHLP